MRFVDQIYAISFHVPFNGCAAAHFIPADVDVVHDRPAIKFVCSSIRLHYLVQRKSLLISCLCNTLWLWTSMVGNQDQHTAVRAIHDIASGCFAEYIWNDLSSVEVVHRCVDKLIVPARLIPSAQAKSPAQDRNDATARAMTGIILIHLLRTSAFRGCDHPAFPITRATVVITVLP